MLDAARANRQQLTDTVQHKYQQLCEQRIEKEKAAKALRDEARKSIDFKKELMQLRKGDQLENVDRWREFSKLYTSKLAEKIVERQQRVKHMQTEQQKIVETCELQRAQMKGFATFQKSKFGQTARNGGEWKSAFAEMNRTH